MKNLLAILIISSLTGCIGIPVPYPRKVTDLPETRGRIVDEMTGEPITDVMVTLSKVRAEKSWDNEIYYIRAKAELLQKGTAHTNISGDFVFQEMTHWSYFKVIWLTFLGTPVRDYSAMNLTYQLDSKEVDLLIESEIPPYFGFREEFGTPFGEKFRRYGPFELGEIKTPIN